MDKVSAQIISDSVRHPVFLSNGDLNLVLRALLYVNHGVSDFKPVDFEKAGVLLKRLNHENI